uniref:WW domain-containing protein n=1 Tax=Alexandrium monilatum TaxID=311494 RepID=A0A7S4SMF1_9DINO
MADTTAALPPDAPAGHAAHQKVKFRANHANPFAFFDYTQDGGKKTLRATIGLAFSKEGAERIARACYVKMFDEGKSSTEVLSFRDECYRKLLAASNGKDLAAASSPRSEQRANIAINISEFQRFTAQWGRTAGCDACNIGPGGRRHSDECWSRREAWRLGMDDPGEARRELKAPDESPAPEKTVPKRPQDAAKAPDKPPAPEKTVLERLQESYISAVGSLPKGENGSDVQWLLEQCEKSGLPEFRYGCRFCGIFFVLRGKMREHLRECDLNPTLLTKAEKEAKNTCEFCKAAFEKRDDLREHKRTCTLKEAEQAQKKAARTAGQGGVDAWNNSSSTWDCVHCGAKFEYRSGLRDHRKLCDRRHSGDAKGKPSSGGKRPGDGGGQRDHPAHKRARAVPATAVPAGNVNPGPKGEDFDMLGPASSSEDSDSDSSDSGSSDSSAGSTSAAPGATAKGAPVAGQAAAAASAAGPTATLGAPSAGQTAAAAPAAAVAAAAAAATLAAPAAAAAAPLAAGGSGLPPNWQEHFNEDYGIPFFFNTVTGASVWLRPTE